MKKFVTESLKEFMALNEKEKAATPKQTPAEKAKEAIKGLQVQLKDAEKPGRVNGTKVQQDKKVEEIRAKIAKWKEKLKNLK